MKQENYLEGIYGCLERIEKKVEILSSAPADKNKAVTGGETGIAMLREIRDGLERDLNGIRTSFSQYAGTLLAVSKSMQDVSGRNPLPDRTAEILAGIRKTGEQTSEEIKALLKTAGDNAKIRNEHRHTVSIESKGILWTFTGMFAMVTVLAVALHAARQPDYDRADNDLKYRYIRMKGEASPENISGLENIFGFNRDNGKINQMRKDVEAYEVFDKDGTYLAVLYTDFHPRAGKRSGAWMTSYKGQWIDEKSGENSRPHVSIVMNFTKPTQNKPALLTFDEVETFLHEFGHSLHEIFANSTYESLSGTNVYWDFVELPSQFMENFAIEKEFLHTFARHYQTGELIPDELVQRIVDSSNFNVAYACLRQVSFGLLDMAWYTRNTPFEGDVKAYEKKAWDKAQILPVVEETCMSTQFSHIFAGGYSAGYYSYKWAEVLDADAFSLFKQCGIFNPEIADSFRRNILSKGGTEHPMTLYKRFRGQEPTIDALLIRNGIKR